MHMVKRRSTSESTTVLTHGSRFIKKICVRTRYYMTPSYNLHRTFNRRRYVTFKGFALPANRRTVGPYESHMYKM